VKWSLFPYVNITCLPGIYNITVGASLLTAIDENPFDNIRTRQFRVVECLENSHCGSSTSYLNCSGSNVVNITAIPTCSGGSCSNTTNSSVIENCPAGCSEGKCKITCHNNSDCGNPFYSDPFCTINNLTRNLTIPTCENPNTILSFCSNVSSLVVNKTCEFGCSNSNCNPGVHDVAILNGIRLETLNGTVVSGIINCEKEYNVIINVSNLGNFYENVTFHGDVGGLLFVNHSDIINFAPGSRVLLVKKVKLDLNPGVYSMGINATIPIDNVPGNNYATRQIQIDCPVCSLDSECGTDTNSDNFCSGKNVYKNYTSFTCNNAGEINSYCSNSTITIVNKTCSQTCSEGKCISCSTVISNWTQDVPDSSKAGRLTAPKGLWFQRSVNITPVNWKSGRIIRTFSDDFMKVYYSDSNTSEFSIYNETWGKCNPRNHERAINITIPFTKDKPFTLRMVSECPCGCTWGNARIKYEYEVCEISS